MNVITISFIIFSHMPKGIIEIIPMFKYIENQSIILFICSILVPEIFKVFWSTSRVESFEVCEEEANCFTLEDTRRGVDNLVGCVVAS